MSGLVAAQLALGGHNSEICTARYNIVSKCDFRSGAFTSPWRHTGTTSRWSCFCAVLDYSQSSLLDHDQTASSEMSVVNLPAQTLMYLSPEGTGRASRVLDARSDLYSTGVILYGECDDSAAACTRCV